LLSNFESGESSNAVGPRWAKLIGSRTQLLRSGFNLGSYIAHVQLSFGFIFYLTIDFFELYKTERIHGCNKVTIPIIGLVIY